MAILLPVCDCGHNTGQHAPAPVGNRWPTPRPCLVAGCGCEHFTQERQKAEAGR